MINFGNSHTVTLRKPWGEVTFRLGDVAYTVTAQASVRRCGGDAPQMKPPNWPTEKYAAILVDPPWYYKTYSDKGRDRCADKHYHTMKLSEIMALPVADIAMPDCVLFMWATDPHLLKAIALIEEWGFTYKTMGFVWVKTCKRDYTKWHMGNGYWTRANPEYCLLATQGHPRRLNADVRELIISPLREHSRKPDEIYPLIERLVPGPYVELFSRTTRDGWDVWGEQSGMFDAE
jgi:N6-adenosine-specific RNA methylase IME4